MTKAFIFTSTTEIQKLIKLLETPVQNTSEKPLYGNTARIYGKTTGIITIAVIARNKGKKPIIETLIENNDINPKYFHNKGHHDPAKNLSSVRRQYVNCLKNILLSHLITQNTKSKRWDVENILLT